MTCTRNIVSQIVFEKTGEAHYINVDYDYGRYEIWIDSVCYATAETRREVDEELADIINTYNWSYVSPIYC